MTLAELVNDALTHGRSDFYNGHPRSYDECENHIRSVFSMNEMTDKEWNEIQKTMNEWFAKYNINLI